MNCVFIFYKLPQSSVAFNILRFMYDPENALGLFRDALQGIRVPVGGAVEPDSHIFRRIKSGLPRARGYQFIFQNTSDRCISPSGEGAGGTDLFNREGSLKRRSGVRKWTRVHDRHELPAYWLSLAISSQRHM